MKTVHPLRASRRLLACAAFLAAVVAGGTTGAPGKPYAFAPIRFLVGGWEGESKGEPGAGTSVRAYSPALGGKFIEVRNTSTYAPQESNPKGEIHEDRGMISFDKAAGKIVMRQFHIEGFVNHYLLESVSDDGNTLVFETMAIENIPPGWRGRETLTKISDDEFVEQFELAGPGKEFAKYSEARFRRSQP